MSLSEAERGVNVQVALRCRPLNGREKERGFLHCVTCDGASNRVRVHHKKMDKTYPYDRVFGPYVSQEEVFASTVAPIVEETLNGFNCTVFAYGQTGTGKTHTMEGEIGSLELMGVIPRSVHAIFDRLERMNADYTVRVSFLELYNEELADLLATRDGSGGGGKVVLREDARRGVMCCGLEEVQVLGAADIFPILTRGIQERKTAETLMNKTSSRSHSIFSLKLMIKETCADGQEVMRNGQLNLVDLAGSECVGRSGATANRAREAGNINQSLLTLGRVITALVEHHPHVPYRDSKLTRLLQESLGGRARTCIIATVTASSDALEETLSTLDYALKAKSIRNRPEPTQHITKKHLLKEYAGEIDTLRSMLQASREKNGVYLEPWRYDQMQAAAAAQKAQIDEMEAALGSKAEEQRALKAERDLLQETQERTEAALQGTQVALDGTKEELHETRGALQCTEENLAATAQELKDTKRELDVMVRMLEATRTELTGSRAVVAEQAATEELLLQQAAQAKQSLELAEADIDGLRRKITSQASELQLKGAAASSYGVSNATAVAALAAAIATFQSDHSAGAAALQGAVTTAAAEAKAADEAAAAAASAAVSSAVAVATALADGAARSGADASAALSRASEAAALAAVKQQEVVEAGRRRIAAALQRITEGLAEQQYAAERATDALVLAAEAAAADVEGFVAGQRELLAAAAAAAASQLEAERTEARRRQTAASELAKKHKEEAAADADKLLRTVTAMVAEARKKAAAAFDAEATALAAQMAASDRAMEEVEMFVISASEEAQAKGTEWATSAAARLDGLAKAARTKVGAVVGAAAGLASGAGTEAIAAADEAAVNATAAAAAGPAAIEPTLAQATTAMTALFAACESGRAAAAVSTRRAEADAAARLSDRVRLAENAGTAFTTALGALRASASHLAVAHGRGVVAYETLVGGYIAKASKVASPSGGTPVRRRYPRAAAFAQTRPHADIAEEAEAALPAMSVELEPPVVGELVVMAPEPEATAMQETVAAREDPSGTSGASSDTEEGAAGHARKAASSVCGSTADSEAATEVGLMSTEPNQDDAAVENAAAPARRGLGAMVSKGKAESSIPRARATQRLRSGPRSKRSGDSNETAVEVSPLHESTNVES